ncbi:peptidase family C78-domain-containing protein [Amylostereum chailletii]|nr:peptidase family C78-domain-containing protein [Amylostereum chailletii]
MSRISTAFDDTDDIEIVSVGKLVKASTSSSDGDHCQLCGQSMAKLDIKRRELHYNQHFAEAEGSLPCAMTRSITLPKGLSSGQESPNRHRHRSDHVGKRKQNKDAFWYASLDLPPPPNYTPGLIPLIKKALITSFERNQTRRAVLCYDRTVHIHHELWDSGWGCGYRNYLIACTALMDQRIQDTYFSLLDSPTGPSIRNLQALIEEAWEHGYDEEGAMQLKHSLVNKTKWIGTAELHVAYTYRGIPSYLADFDLQGNDLSPLLDWIKEYFSPASEKKRNTVEDAWRDATPVTVTDRMPLILQHNGHSRTIIGYEITKVGHTNLLTFDPSRCF